MISEIYEGALRADPHCWQAPWLEGRLFLSGYNEAAARKELTRALQINPAGGRGAGDARPGRPPGLQARRRAGRRPSGALAINPHYAPAYVLLADLNISDERFVDANAAARKAVAENPRDEDALARLAASCRLLVDPVGAAAAEAAALANNPRPATFYAALGERLADRRKYHSAERAFLLAAAADPSRADAPIGLGMLYMQIGREAEARRPLRRRLRRRPVQRPRRQHDEGAQAHGRVRARRRPSIHASWSTRSQDELLGKYMSRYLESIYGELTERFGYAPPEPTKIEIMKNHQWFSGRTIGLPFIPTVGACTGKVVALASPKATASRSTGRGCSSTRWSTSSPCSRPSSTSPTGTPRPWPSRAKGFPGPRSGTRCSWSACPPRKLLNLDTINLGFIRPKEPEDRQMAYCQAQLYARYMLKRFGSDALIKMLDRLPPRPDDRPRRSPTASTSRRPTSRPGT